MEGKGIGLCPSECELRKASMAVMHAYGRCLDVDDYFYILNDKVFHEITSLEDMNLVRYRVQNCNSSPTQQFYLTPAGDGAG
jgi:hypothetical protein